MIMMDNKREKEDFNICHNDICPWVLLVVGKICKNERKQHKYKNVFLNLQHNIVLNRNFQKQIINYIYSTDPNDPNDHRA